MIVRLVCDASFAFQRLLDPPLFFGCAGNLEELGFFELNLMTAISMLQSLSHAFYSHTTPAYDDPLGYDAPSDFIDARNSLPRRVSRANQGRDAVLESLISESQHACARIVVVASWTTALVDPEIAVSAPTVRALIPEDPALMVTMRRWVETSTLELETLQSTDEFFASLSVARKAFDMFLGEAHQIGFVRAGILHRTVLNGAWRYALDRALETLQVQAFETRENLPEIYSDNGSALEALLIDVQSGGTPGLNPDGTIRLPDIPNQRRSARRYLLENCLVKTDRKSFSAFARDVSTGGLGLDRVPPLPCGSLVMVKLPTGRTFNGRVAWYKNASAGITFDTPLAPNDPLVTL